MPGEITKISQDPQGWLRNQIQIEGVPQTTQTPLEGHRDRLLELYAYQDAVQAAKAMGLDKPTDGRRDLRIQSNEDFLQRTLHGTTTPDGFAERWALFWCNWFTVSGTRLETQILMGAFEREAIRPNVFGPFSRLLEASSTHPAMMFYLDQARSIGPNSPAGLRAKQGLNENLAREILELHSLGVNGGYSQADVTELARVLTGWSIGGKGEAPSMRGQIVYRQAAHEPGARKILGKTYGQPFELQSRAVFADLSVHPSTARHVAQRLAIAFHSDTPPESLIEALKRAYLDTGGQLSEVARTLIAHQSLWDQGVRKFRSPYEHLIAAYRAAGTSPKKFNDLGILATLGQKPTGPNSPKGWPDDEASWAAPDAIITRLGWAQNLARFITPETPPVDLAKDILGSRLSDMTATAISRAQSKQEAFALLLMAPEFLRR